MRACRLGLILFLLVSIPPSQAGTTPAGTTEEKTALDLTSFESIYTASSNLRGGQHGDQEVVENSFSYGHRFALKGPVFLRTGIEFDRYDFSGSAGALLPTKLQSVAVALSIEYVIQNHVGAAIEVHPGFYFENQLGSRQMDIPWDAYVTIPISKTVYGVAGIAGAMFYEYPVNPIAGIIWLINDKVRLEGVFPKASLVYNQSDSWEFCVFGEINGGGFRVDHDSGLSPKLSGAAVEYNEYRAGGKVTYSYSPKLDLVLNAGYSFQREFIFPRADKKFEFSGSPFVSFEINAEY